MDYDDKRYNDELFEEEMRKAQRELDRMNRETRLYVKRRMQVVYLILFFAFVILITGLIPIFVPAAKPMMDIACGIGNIGMSVINFYQFLSALKWNIIIAVLMFCVMVANIVLGVTNFI